MPDTPSIASVMREIAMQIPSECDIGRRPPAHVAEPIVASRYEIRHTAHLWPKVSRGSPWACCASSFGPSLIRRFHLRGYGGQVGGQAWIAIHPPKHCPAHASELSTLVSGLWTETGTGPGGTFRSTPPAWPDRSIQVPWRFRDLDLLHERESPSGTVLASQIMGVWPCLTPPSGVCIFTRYRNVTASNWWTELAKSFLNLAAVTVVVLVYGTITDSEPSMAKAVWGAALTFWWWVVSFTLWRLKGRDR